MYWGYVRMAASRDELQIDVISDLDGKCAQLALPFQLRPESGLRKAIFLPLCPILDQPHHSQSLPPSLLLCFSVCQSCSATVQLPSYS